MQSAHRIQRLTIRSRTENQSDAFALQRQLKADWETLLPIFDQQFDRLADGHQTVRIRKLKLTLKVTSIDKLSTQLSAALLEELQAERHMPGENITGNTVPATHSEPSISTLPPAESSIPFGHESRQGALVYYLQSGSLPWYSQDISDAPDQLRKHVSHHNAELNAWLSNHNSPEIFSRWLQLLVTIKPSIRLIDYIEALLPGDTNGRPWRRLFKAVIDHEFPIRSEAQKLTILSTLLAVAAQEPSDEKTTHPIAPPHEIDDEQWMQWQDRLLQSGLQRAFINNVIRPVLIQTSNHQTNNKQHRQGKRSISTRKQAQQLSTHNEEPTDLPATTVQLAGCILLHPYLLRLFAACNIQRDDKRIHPEHLDRAAALIVFAAKGDESALDFELALIKLLLGIAPDAELLVTPGLLNSADKAEVETLLSALIKHWARLKNTSVNGLRQTFLQRSGWLKTDQTEWQLHIDRRGPDVLIDFLPFSISMVKLPWMQKPLHVNW